jgi:peroxiredoxin
MRQVFLAAAVIAAASSLAVFAQNAPAPAPATPAAPAAAAAPAAPTTPAKVAKVGEEAPAFKLTDSKGKEVALADYKGKVVVLEWINRDCPIDRRVIESKLISTVYDKFKDKVVWLAIDSTAAHTVKDHEATIEQFKLGYPVLNDAKGTVGHLYAAETTPHMYIISTEGKLVYKGAIDDDPNGTKPTKVNYVDKALTELFAGKPISIAENKAYGCTVKY